MLIVARHGRTAINAAGRLLGRLDPPLDDLGVQQAARLAAGLPGVVRVVSSPLQRAQATAAAFGLPVEVDERWIELDYGDLDGVAMKDVPPATWQRWRSDPAWTPPGGESLLALHARVGAACEDLMEAAATEDVVVVTHVSPVKAAMAWAMGVGVQTGWRSHVDQGSITRIGIGPAGPVLRSFNETQHLTSLS